MGLPYYPYFRGKQFELITIRENARLLSESGFVPIIEPVRESLRGLENTLKAICEADGKAIVIVNPQHGDHSTDGVVISQLMTGYKGTSISAGLLLRNDTSSGNALQLCQTHHDYHPSFIHAGFTQPKELAEGLEAGNLAITRHVFIETYAELLYRRHFSKSERVIVRDGFKRQRNADYPPNEVFSELHLTYPDMGMDCFGDFLIVGDEYSESGGPAYAVAIHLTYFDPERENVMYVYHFVSDTRDTPTDPAGKFAQALQKLVELLDSKESHIYETEAIMEFRDLHKRGHFPGLGYVKKLSMQHHIETLARGLD